MVKNDNKYPPNKGIGFKTPEGATMIKQRSFKFIIKNLRLRTYIGFNDSEKTINKTFTSMLGVHYPATKPTITDDWFENAG